MTEQQFRTLCAEAHETADIHIRHDQCALRGRLVGCWDSYLVIDDGRQYVLWPYAVCDRETPSYHIPSYA